MTLVEILLVCVMVAVAMSITVAVTRKLAQSAPDPGAEADAETLDRPPRSDRSESEYDLHDADGPSGDPAEDFTVDAGDPDNVYASEDIVEVVKAPRASAPVTPSSGLGLLQQLLATASPAVADMQRLIKQLAVNEMAYAWDLIDELPWSPGKDEARKALLAQWARLDPAAAIDFAANSVSSRRRRMDALRTIADVWRESDPAAVFAWYLEHPGGRMSRQLSLGKVLKKIYQDNPSDGLEALWKLPNGRAQMRAMFEMFLSDDSEAGRKALIDIYDDAPDSGARTAVAEALARSWAVEDPLAAANWVERLSDPAVRTSAIQAVATTWGQMDPEGAVRWLQRLGSVGGAEKALFRVVNGWAGDDPESVLAWIDRQSDGGIKDAALMGSARSIGYREPRRAMDLAASIGERAKREKAMDSVARHWVRRDREAAVIYILSSDLPDRIKRKYAERALRE